MSFEGHITNIESHQNSVELSDADMTHIADLKTILENDSEKLLQVLQDKNSENQDQWEAFMLDFERAKDLYNQLKELSNQHGEEDEVIQEMRTEFETLAIQIGNVYSDIFTTLEDK